MVKEKQTRPINKICVISYAAILIYRFYFDNNNSCINSISKRNILCARASLKHYLSFLEKHFSSNPIGPKPWFIFYIHTYGSANSLSSIAIHLAVLVHLWFYDLIYLTCINFVTLETLFSEEGVLGLTRAICLESWLILYKRYFCVSILFIWSGDGYLSYPHLCYKFFILVFFTIRFDR